MHLINAYIFCIFMASLEYVFGEMDVFRVRAGCHIRFATCQLQYKLQYVLDSV